MDTLKELFMASWLVFGQMSPFLILGFIISGILSVLVSSNWIKKHLGKNKIISVVKAAMLGVPLPLCSCGVIPVATSLKKSGASDGATASFLISTPQTGVDSILATYGLLGPMFAIFRPLAALFMGIIGGMSVTLSTKEDNSNIVGAEQKDELEPAPQSHSLFSKIKLAFEYAFVTLPSEISKALVIGIILSGIMTTFIEGSFLNSWLSNYYINMLLMVLIGMPLYVCSTSSIPIALGFIKMGVSPGAALVFLIAGPATNAATTSVIIKILGKKSALIYILTIFLGALASGLVFDVFNQSFTEAHISSMASHEHLSIFETASAIFMLVVILYSFAIQYFAKKSCIACEHEHVH